MVPLPSKNQQKCLPWYHSTLSFSIQQDLPKDFGKIGLHYLDLDRVQGRLILRSWKQGDRMIPLGMQQYKKLSDIFVDEKYDPIQKKLSWVLWMIKGLSV